MTGCPKHLRENGERLASLKRYANWLRGYYAAPVYLCGSALIDFNAEPRDWDVRVKLSNAEFGRHFGDPAAWVEEGDTGDWTRVRWKWSDECVKMTRLGWKNTGLNIDFQIYPPAYWQRFDGEPRLRLDTRGRS